MKYLLSIFFIFQLSCTNKIQPKLENNVAPEIEAKHIAENLTLHQKIVELNKSMLEYMKTGQPLYSKSDVDKCSEILESYIAEISKSKSKEEAMNMVKSTVLKLNYLNNNAKSELIETEERERIADIIISATHKKGYNSMDEDITGNWREW
ncbi:hypothetical protein [Kaistella sp.]|uniref:hypothetical protein n=1 Tax=Kaistella sp. TaxID=2782235 RepID=UPI003C564DAC